ncbi:hypothetical protein M153_6820004385, partial [Pseudoloma neurophilia]
MEKKKIIIILGVLAAVIALGITVLVFWLRNGEREQTNKSNEKEIGQKLLPLNPAKTETSTTDSKSISHLNQTEKKEGTHLNQTGEKDETHLNQTEGKDGTHLNQTEGRDGSHLNQSEEEDRTHLNQT